MKTTDDLFSNFENMASKIKKRKSPKDAHYEISFENKKDFNKFVRNMYVLMAIQNHKPHSVYKLAKLIDKDLSNVKKVVAFFESIGALTIKEEKVSGRTVKKPVVDYQTVEFDLQAA